MFRRPRGVAHYEHTLLLRRRHVLADDTYGEA
jgi:hypothetical protein